MTDHAWIPHQRVGVPALHHALAPALGLAAPDVVAPVRGPRIWWAGPLDVEGLALGSVQAALTAANALIGGQMYAVDAARLGSWFASFEHLRIAGRATRSFAPLSGFFACADGWVRLHGNYPHHSAAIGRAVGDVVAGTAAGGAGGGGAADRAQVERALRAVPAADAEAAVRAEGGVAAAVRDAGDWLASPMGRAVDADPWIRFAITGAGAGAPLGRGRVDHDALTEYEPLSRPLADLSGLRVLDLTRVVAGPGAGRLLGLLGAQVLRIDPPTHPELLDHHLDTSFGKTSAIADLAQAATLAKVRDLLTAADVLITGYRPGALARYGLDAATLATELPALAVVEIDAWGDHGPWGRDRGFDSIVQAATGLADIYAGSSPDGTRRPGQLPVQALDHATGYGAAAAALALVHRRHATGAAGSAHLSLAGTAHALLRLPGADPARVDLPIARGELESPYGLLSYAAPAVIADGRHLDYPTPPTTYGADPLAWTAPKAASHTT